MAEPLPDPTPAEARALIFGAGTFWTGWGLAAVTLFAHRWLIGLVPFFAAFAAGIWLYFGGVFQIALRYSTTTGRQSLRGVRRSPWRMFSDSLGWSWMRALTPSYFRRAARTLGWPEPVVLGVLASLLASDLVIYVWMMATLPAGTRG